MSLAVIYTRANMGVDAPLVSVETHLSNGLPSMSIVGLPEAAVKESRERVRSAILNASLQFPQRRITVNLAPADLPKSSGRFDLAIALSILVASDQIPGYALAGYEFLGELALSGELRGVAGVIPALVAARDSERALVLPHSNREEARLVRDARPLCGAHLLDVCAHFLHGRRLQVCSFDPQRSAIRPSNRLAEIRGQQQAKRALQVAAAGRHNLLLIGPPGTGKTLLANCLVTLLPDLTEQEALESAAVRSITRQPLDPQQWLRPAFRSPHHTATDIALVGGGNQARPGEVTLAHRGVLFLDELTEFRRSALESMREPLEARTITVSRANLRLQYPANFQLIAAMNPCQCGFYGDPSDQCRCTPEKIHRYLEKISGPLLDRVDMSIEVARPDWDMLSESRQADDITAIRSQILACRVRQLDRTGKTNSEMTGRETETHCRLLPADAQILRQAMDKLKLSARAYHRILRMARTIADLEASEHIRRTHLGEAISYRSLDRYFSFTRNG